MPNYIKCSLRTESDVFVNHIQGLLGVKANHRAVKAKRDKHVLREMAAPYYYPF